MKSRNYQMICQSQINMPDVKDCVKNGILMQWQIWVTGITLARQENMKIYLTVSSLWFAGGNLALWQLKDNGFSQLVSVMQLLILLKSLDFPALTWLSSLNFWQCEPHDHNFRECVLDLFFSILAFQQNQMTADKSAKIKKWMIFTK